jgi:hypothetical protein
MLLPKSSARLVCSAIVAAGCFVAGMPAIVSAQGLPGLTIFSGIERRNELNYRLSWGTTNLWDTYFLRIPGKKIDLAVSQFTISYPDYYKGKFDPKKVEVRVKNKPVELEQVNWDKENHFLQINLKQPIEPGSKVEIVLDNVKNPDFPGTFYFNLRVLSLQDVPLPKYIGTWIIGIDRG